MKNKKLSSVIGVLLITSLPLLGIFAVNSFTAPVIAENRSAADFAPLMAVMPDAQGFETIFEAAAPSETELNDIPETVKGIYAETSGLGYALKLSTAQGYTGEPMEFSLGIDAQGCICGIEISAYPESRDIGAEYVSGFIGRDSALTDVGLVAGATFSSSAFKNAVADGFAALTENNLISAGLKTDGQLLMELLGELNTGFINPAGVLQLEELEPAEGIDSSMAALNGGSYAEIAARSEGSCLVTVNISGDALAADTEGSIINDRLDPALLEGIKARAAEKLSSFAETDLRRFRRMLSENAEFTELPLKGVFSTVTGAYRVNVGGNEYLALAARSYGYANEIMPVYCILDSRGAIVSVSVPELIFHRDYFDDYILDESAYKKGFTGLDAESFTGGQAFISGATMSTDAMRTALNDIFDAYAILSENGGAADE